MDHEDQGSALTAVRLSERMRQTRSQIISIRNRETNGETPGNFRIVLGHVGWSAQRSHSSTIEV